MDCYCVSPFRKGDLENGVKILNKKCIKISKFTFLLVVSAKDQAVPAAKKSKAQVIILTNFNQIWHCRTNPKKM